MARTPPSSGYLEPDDHPASTTAYTAIDDMASTNSTPMLRSAPTSVISRSPMWKERPMGTTMKVRKAGMIARVGASRYMPSSTLLGVTCSLKNSLRPSATVCSTPNGPARSGPTRLCMSATILRSPHTSSSTTTTSRAKTATTLASAISTSTQSISPPPWRPG